MILRSKTRWGVLLVVLLLLDQAVLHLFLADGTFRGRRIAPFDPPLFNASQERAFERLKALGEGASVDVGAADVVFDGELGWAPPRDGGQGLFLYDAAGTRFARERFPRPKVAGVRRVAAIGCSFTRGDEVEAHEAWPALVDEEGELEVANLGVGGYGLDQALLRYRRDVRELEADEVWITVLPAALARLVNEYRPALRHWDGSVGFKPRFHRQGDGTLRLLRCPVGTPAEAAEALSDQRAFLRAASSDAIVMRNLAAYSPVWSRASHFTALGRCWLTVREHRGRDNWTLVTDEHLDVPSLARDVLRLLASDVSTDGALLRVFVVPCQKDLRLAREAGTPYWRGIELEDTDVPWLDLTDALDAAGATDDDALWRPGGHLSPRGNRVVADLLLDAVR